MKKFDTTDIIIVVWNHLAYTKATIESIYKHTENFRLIIVNNNSDVETTQYIDSLNSRNEVIVIQNSINVGYTKAVNQGLSLAQNDVVLANNDIIVTKDWLNILKSHVCDKVGIVSGVTNFASGLQLLHDLPIFDENLLDKYSEFRRNEFKGLYVSFPRVIFFCTLFTRKCLNEVGILDEIFSPGNFEDDDFCRRAEMKGYDTRIALDCFVYHFGSVSFNKNSDYLKLLATNEAKFKSKHGATPNDLWGDLYQELKGKMK
jgi:GT2 family glycosyltransferase